MNENIRNVYAKYTSRSTDVVTQVEVNNINPSLVNVFASVVWYAAADYVTQVTPTAGTVTIEYYDEALEAWVMAPESPVVASVPLVKVGWYANSSKVRATPAGITGAAAYKLIVVGNTEGSVADSVVTLTTPKEIVITDSEGKSPMSTVFGEIHTGFKQDDISAQFQYNISSRDVSTTTSGTGTATSANAEAVLATGGGVGLAQLTSIDSVRYRPGHETIAMFTSRYENAQSGVNMKHGLYNAQNGLAFGYQGSTFGVWFKNASSEQFIPQSSFSADKLDGSGSSGLVIDPSKINIYKITYGWLGVAPIVFSVYGGLDKGWIKTHVIDLVNFNTGPHLSNPSLPMTAIVERTAGTGSSTTLKTSSWRAGVVAGGPENNNANRWFDFVNTITDIPAGLVANEYIHIFSLQSQSTFQGVVNHIRSELGVASFATDMNKSIEFVGIVNGTLSGNTAFTPRDSVNSVMYTSTGGTVTGTSSGASTVLAKASDRRTDVQGTGIYIRPGVTFSLGCRVAGAVGSPAIGTASGGFRWKEEF